MAFPLSRRSTLRGTGPNQFGIPEDLKRQLDMMGMLAARPTPVPMPPRVPTPSSSSPLIPARASMPTKGLQLPLSPEYDALIGGNFKTEALPTPDAGLMGPPEPPEEAESETLNLASLKVGPPPSEGAPHISEFTTEEIGADTEDRERRRRTLEGYRNIAEGLGNMFNKPITAGGVMYGQEQDPFIAEDTRSEIGRLEDELPLAARQMYSKALGVELPEGTRRQDMNDFFRMGRESSIMKRHNERMYESQERRAQRDYSMRRIPNVDRRELTRSQGIIQGMKRAGDLYRELLTEGTMGPIWGRVQMIAHKLGVSSSEPAEIISSLSYQMSQFIYLMTGKQMNEQEMKRLERVLPQPYAAPEQFEAVLKNFMTTTQRRHDNTIASLERDGFDVSGWREAVKESTEEAKPETPEGPGEISGPMPGEIEVIHPDGDEVFIKEAEWPQAELEGYRRK